MQRYPNAPFLSLCNHIVYCSSRSARNTLDHIHTPTNDTFFDFGLTRRLWTIRRRYRRSYGYQSRTIRSHRHVDQSHVAKMIDIQDLQRWAGDKYDMFIGSSVRVPCHANPSPRQSGFYVYNARTTSTHQFDYLTTLDGQDR